MTVYEVMKHNYEHGIKEQGVATFLHPGEEDVYALRFHETDVVVAYSDGSVKLDSDGYNVPRIYNGRRPVTSPTTRERISRYLPEGCVIYQEKNKWYVRGTNFGDAEFYDGMIVSESGVFATHEEAANQAEYEAWATYRYYERTAQ